MCCVQSLADIARDAGAGGEGGAAGGNGAADPSSPEGMLAAATDALVKTGDAATASGLFSKCYDAVCVCGALLCGAGSVALPGVVCRLVL